MAWITITEADVTSRLSGPELTAMKTAALASGQTNPLTEVIGQVVQQIRGYVAGNRSNTLGDGETIPDRLLGAALALIRWSLVSRLPGTGLLTEERRREQEDATTLLRDVAAGRFAVDVPAAATSEVESASSPSVTAKTRTFTRNDQDGI